MSFWHRVRSVPRAVWLAVLFASVALSLTWMNIRQATEADRLARLIELQTAQNAKLDARCRVIYAIKDVPEGSDIPRNALVEREIPQMRKPIDAIDSGYLDNLVGRAAKYGISAGSIVSQHDIAALELDYCMNGRLSKGMKAVSFQVDDSVETSGVIEPDSFIDVYATTGSGAQTKTVPVVSHARVLGVGALDNKYNYEHSRCPHGSITVVVTPKQAHKLLLLLASSNVYLRSISTVRAKSMRVQ